MMIHISISPFFPLTTHDDWLLGAAAAGEH